MKNKVYLLLCFILPAVFYLGCDDAGVIPPFIAKGKVSISSAHLKTLDPNVDGMYQLWIAMDSAGVRTWGSCGKFNVNSGGSAMDINGNPAVLNFAGDTTRLGLSTAALITIEKGTVTVPGNQRLMSGTVTATSDSVFGSMDIAGIDAFGTIGQKLELNETGRYIRWSPSTNNQNSSQGIWLCDSSGVSHMPDGIALPTTGGWVYQAWLVDKTNNTYRSMGRFFDPKAVDDDLTGPCAGPNSGFNAPGQDWIQTGGSCGSSAVNVIAGNYQLLVTMEPSNEIPGSIEYNTPSFFKMYLQNIDQTLGVGQLDYLYSIHIAEPFPTARVMITN